MRILPFEDLDVVSKKLPHPIWVSRRRHETPGWATTVICGGSHA